MGKFQVNGATIAIPDPVTTVWSDEGERGRTHSGALQSQAFSTAAVRWKGNDSEQRLSFAEFKILMDLYYTIVSGAAGKVTSITIPNERGGDPTTWPTYTQPNTLGIWPRKPTGTPEGHQYRDVEWVFEHVKMAES